MTKKDKVLKLFNEATILLSPSGEETKIIGYSDLQSVGLAPNREYVETYNDVVYAARILRKMGHRVLVGTSMFVRLCKK